MKTEAFVEMSANPKVGLRELPFPISILENSYATVCISAITIECTVLYNSCNG